MNTSPENKNILPPDVRRSDNIDKSFLNAIDINTSVINKSIQSQTPSKEEKLKRTDFGCCICFSIIFIIFLSISIFSISLGNLDTFGAPRDPDHVICGVDPTAIDYPYIYFSTPIVNPENKDQNYLYRTVCVKECPINLITKIYWAKIKCLPNSLVKTCAFQAAPIEESVLFYDTVEYLGKICLPKATSYYEWMKYYINPSGLTNFINDLKTAYWVVIGSLMLTLIFGVLGILFILNYLYLFLVCFFSLSMILSGMFIYKASSLHKLDKSIMFQDSTELIKAANGLTNNATVDWFIGIFFLVLAIGTILGFIYLKYSGDLEIMRNMIKVVKAFINQNKYLPIFAVIKSLILFIFLAGILKISLYSFSFTHLKNIPLTERYPFKQTENDIFFLVFLWGLWFFALWIVYFFVAFQEYVIYGTCYKWYQSYAINKKILKSNKLLKEKKYDPMAFMTYVKLSFTHKIGSLALGSFMTLCFGFLNTVISFLKDKIFDHICDQKGFMFNIFSCLYRYLEINDDLAYIIVAIEGKDFQHAGSEIADIINEDIELFDMVSLISFYFLSMLNITCALSTMCVSYCILNYSSDYTTIMSSTTYTTIFIGIVAMLIIMILNNIVEGPIVGLIVCYLRERRERIRLMTSNIKETNEINLKQELLASNLKDMDKADLERISNDNDLNEYLQFCKKRKLDDQNKRVKNTEKDEKIVEPIKEQNESKFKTPIKTLKAPTAMPNSFNIDLLNFPKSNDRYRITSPDKNYKDKIISGASKHKIKGETPFKEPPYSDIIKKNLEEYNFQKNDINNIININLNLENEKK